MNNLSKKLLTTTGVLAVATSALFTNAAQADSMSSYMENALIDVCKSAAKNNTIRFNNMIEGYHLKTQTVALKVVCNGENIADFAASNGAYKTADRLNESMGDVSIEDVAMNDGDKLYVNF